MARTPPLALVYALLMALRIASALFGYAYIHPDEHFQSGEAAFRDLFGIATQKTWEFDPAFPCRSMASIRLFNLPAAVFAALSAQGTVPSARALFTVQRVTFLVASFALDYVVYQLSPRTRRLSALCLLAASSSVLTFQIRPFSNSVEAIALALSFLAYQKITTALFVQAASFKPTSLYIASLALGALASLGFFSRFTFVLFFLPVGIAFLSALTTSDQREASTRFAAFALAAIAFAATSGAHITFDSQYYSQQQQQQQSSGFASQLVLSPLNAFLYNFRPQNVALHGVHPRWLHSIVNYPMVVGVSTVAVLLCSAYSELRRIKVGRTLAKEQEKGRGAGVSSSLLSSTILTSIAGLSISSHQEPRFLLPLVVPSILLFSHALASSSRSHRWTKCALWLFALQQILQTLFFGFWHQAGLVPALFHIDAHLLSPTSDQATTVYFYETFMVPHHLLPSLSPQTKLISDNTRSPSELLHVVQHKSNGISYVVAPTWAIIELQEEKEARGKVIELASFGPHLDMDHISEMWSGLKKGRVQLVLARIERRMTTSSS